MSGSVEDRASAYRDLEKQKVSLAVTWEQLTRLDEFLAVRFGIGQLPDRLDWWGSLEATCGAALAREYRSLHERQAEYYSAGRRPPHTLERAFYNLIAQDPLFGLVHSQKRPFILDAAALLTRLVEVGGIRGPALDVGCNGGYHVLWLAAQGGLSSVLGIDDASACVAYAERMAASSITTETTVAFKAAAFGDQAGAGAYELLYSIDGGLTIEDSRAIRIAAKSLCDGGVLVVCQRAPARWSAPIKEAESLGLGLVILDVVGGWDGREFGAEPVFVFVKGATSGCPRDPKAESESIWVPGFRDYANSGVRPFEKNQAYYRTSSVHGRRGG